MAQVRAAAPPVVHDLAHVQDLEIDTLGHPLKLRVYDKQLKSRARPGDRLLPWRGGLFSAIWSPTMRFASPLRIRWTAPGRGGLPSGSRTSLARGPDGRRDRGALDLRPCEKGSDRPRGDGGHLGRRQRRRQPRGGHRQGPARQPRARSGHRPDADVPLPPRSRPVRRRSRSSQRASSLTAGAMDWFFGHYGASTRRRPHRSARLRPARHASDRAGHRRPGPAPRRRPRLCRGPDPGRGSDGLPRGRSETSTAASACAR